MFRAIKIKLYPNKQQEQVINKILGCYRFVYNHMLAKAIQEVGFYRFKSVLLDKSLNNEKRVVFVDRFYPSSKTCSCCGYVYRKLTLKEREWNCPDCGEIHDRDLNAAMNILTEGERILESSK